MLQGMRRDWCTTSSLTRYFNNHAANERVFEIAINTRKEIGLHCCTLGWPLMKAFLRMHSESAVWNTEFELFNPEAAHQFYFLITMYWYVSKRSLLHTAAAVDLVHHPRYLWTKIKVRSL